jgi:hypothetical protein
MPELYSFKDYLLSKLKCLWNEKNQPSIPVLYVHFSYCHSRLFSERNQKIHQCGLCDQFKACEECVKADAGFSIRIGRISEKRLGYYAGFIYFKEFHPDWEV